MEQNRYIHPVVIELRQRRRALRLTRFELAVKTGFFTQTIQKIECGDRQPKLATVEAYANVVGMEIALTSIKDHMTITGLRNMITYIHQQRLFNRISQKKLAEAAGYSYRVVQNIDRGGSGALLKRVEDVAKVFDLIIILQPRSVPCASSEPTKQISTHSTTSTEHVATTGLIVA